MDNAIQLWKSQAVNVLERGTEEYDRAIVTSNLIFRFSVPDCVVRPKTASEVQAVVKVARAQKLKLVIKCNGHSYAGHSTASVGSVSLDLRDMKQIDLDFDRKVISFDGGCQWGRVYQTLINGGYDGYVINGGRCPTVGVGGFLLGGGLGPFTRSFGMGSDTLIEATMVTATGDLVTVKETDNSNSKEGQLFWALCGAGGGNFGVVVRMKVGLQQLKNRNGMVVAGRHTWFPKGGLADSKVLDTMQEFYTVKWPDEMTIDANWIFDLREKDTGCIRFIVSFNGSKEEYDSIIDKGLKNDELKTQLKRRVLPEKSTRYLCETLYAQWFEKTARAYPTNKGYELYSSFVFKNDDANLIKQVMVSSGRLMKEHRDSFANEKVSFQMTWIHSGGKATEKNPTDSAFFWREAVFQMYVTVLWEDKWMERDMRRFIDTVKDALRPLSLNREAAFVNFPDRDFPKNAYEKYYFGGNREKLQRVKQIWDPSNFFDAPQGIRLPGAPETPEKGEPGRGEDNTDGIATDEWPRYNGSRWKAHKTTDVQKDLNYLASLGF